MKRDLKIFSSVLFITIIAAVTIVFIVYFAGTCLLHTSRTYKGIEQIEQGRYIFYSDILERVGDYEDAYYQYYFHNMGIFTSEASTLILEYTPENYALEKQKIEDEYIFQKAPIEDEAFGGVIFEEYEFNIGEWEFICCYSDGWTKFEYVDRFRIVGFNERENSIAYLDFEDNDLDSIDDAEDFIIQYFNYDFSK